MAELGSTRGDRGANDRIPRGRVIGATDATGNEVKECPISAVDFMATVCHVLGIDCKKEIDTPTGRPNRIVDNGEHLIHELL